MTNTLVFILLILIVLLLGVLLFILLKNRKSETVEDKYEYVKSLKEQKQVLDKIKMLDLPKTIENLPNNQLMDISRKIYRVYETLDYKNQTKDYYANSWHSWQFSVFLALYKKDLDLFIPNKESVFKLDILLLDEVSLKDLINKIVFKYKKEVNTSLEKDILCRNKIWSGEEISILMYFLSKYKDVK